MNLINLLRENKGLLCDALRCYAKENTEAANSLLESSPNVASHLRNRAARANTLDAAIWETFNEEKENKSKEPAEVPKPKTGTRGPDSDVRGGGA